MEINNERNIVRELAKKYYEIAMSPRHIRMRQRFRDTNDLKIVRPPLNIEEIPWHEMNIGHELDLICEDSYLRNMEYTFRKELYREKHFFSDSHLYPYWPVYKAYSSTGNGFHVKDETIATDKKNHIVSHKYIDVLEDEDALELFHLPIVTAYPDKDKENIALAEEVLGDILPVRLIGHGIYYAPWDIIVRLHGVENVFNDIYERPEFLHMIIKLFTDAKKSEMEQMNALGLYDSENKFLHCTPGDVTVNAPSEDGHSCKDIWFRTMAQSFSSISPSMHYELDVQYSLPLSELCAYTYYGCCEPLHDRLDIIKRYKNLRKIGVSPWADLEKSAEQIGGNYVLSRKPNPANVAINADVDIIRKEITDTVSACLKYGCPCDITLKDISTVGYKPQNLFIWSKTASEVLDRFYGKE